MPRHALPALVTVVIVPVLAAQTPALKDVHRVFPALRDHPALFAIGDVDGDGHRDVVFAGSSTASLPQGAVWLGAADSVFRGRFDAFPIVAQRPTAIALSDLDGDGDLDCAWATGTPIGSANGASPHLLFVNDGTGHFTPSPHGPLAASGGSTSIVAGDIDGDGDRDLIVGRRGLPLGWYDQVWLNAGNGQMTYDPNRLTAPTPATAALALFDRDGDGDLDLYRGAVLPGFDVMFDNDGAGWFTPLATSTTPGSATLDVKARDFDGDGDVDLLTLGDLGVQYRRNDGTGTFTSSVPAMSPAPGAGSQLVVENWNADGLLDFGVRTGGSLQLMVQTAPGQFAPSVLSPLPTAHRAILALDNDGDGDGDVLAPSGYTIGPAGPDGIVDSQWFRNLGTTWEIAPPPSPVPPLSWGSATRTKLVDIDGDGDLDVLRSPHLDAGALLLGDGGGAFVPVPASALADWAVAVPGIGDTAAGDVDGDGDLDLVVTIRFEPNATPPFCKLYRNTGTGFVASTLAPLYADRVALGDVDGDGDLDAVLGGVHTRAVLFNDGTGAFAVSVLALPATAGSLSDPVHLVDLDGDLDLDIATYIAASQAGYLRNDGSGGFTAVPIPGMATWPRVIAADFENDGDTDLCVDGGNTTPRQLLRNNGGGVFTITILSATPGTASGGLIPADLDGDGWTDLVELHGVATSRVLLNDQLGAFVSVPGSLDEPPAGFADGAVGDLDGDGDIDLLLSGNAGTMLYRNLRHQVAWHALPRIGRTLTIDLYGRANEFHALGVAFAPAAPPLALPGFGMLRLDPASLLIVATGSYDANGVAAFTFAVPNDPALLGLSLYWQALSLGIAPHLGNVDVTTLTAR